MKLQTVGMLLAACMSSAMAAGDPSVSRQAFGEVAKVLQSPRCMNCHTITDFPRQGDDRHPHAQLIKRGPDNMGTPSLMCMACHQAANSADGLVPGAPNWHLAPLSMGWEGLSAGQMCRRLVDKTRNGNRDTPALVAHMTADPLVQWAWHPGAGRTLPPLSQQDFHEVVRRWADNGAYCPR
ncbi:hypothetical protein [Chromobacterium sphagni]|uniref:Uncharacterized protein n=1 Tax=Chromobacterium sphagni TaxID=1903179 RepID=A0A1S1X4T4_9NEIS|nr:hypothetical protein [Chromobacterium sphagni]OHX14482.1 hypothetical protein BI347_13940 [Chromobacterium sphagni]OHX19063.1 hypothetical protein BI344_19510 [Chromobacterium sphagni]